MARIREAEPALHARARLGYLQGRAHAEAGELEPAERELGAFLAEGDPLQDLALHHLSRVALAQGRPQEAARLRQVLVETHPGARYRAEAVEAQGAWLEGRADVTGLDALLGCLTDADGPARARELRARAVAVLAATGGTAEAAARGLGLLREGVDDDAALRVALVLDRPAVVEALPAEDVALLGETWRAHRHFDLALPLLARAAETLPDRRDELLFAVGRSHFGADRLAPAEEAYLRLASATADLSRRAEALYHAARCAQLLGDDGRAERHLAAAAAAGGKARPAALALVQRLRTHLHHRRFRSAAADLEALRRRFGHTPAMVDAALAYASGMVVARRGPSALRALLLAPRRHVDAARRAEIAYWRGRALERGDPAGAVLAYLRVLGATPPTHFATFARERLAAPALAAHARRLAASRGRTAAVAAEAGRLEAAREAAAEALRLAAPEKAEAARESLRSICERQPRCAEALRLEPLDLPRFPLPAPEGLPPGSPPARLDLLLAMGLFDDARDLVPERWGLDDPREGLTRAEALRLGGAPRSSIHAAEVVAGRLPAGLPFELLSPALQRLLYPRPFSAEVSEQAAANGLEAALLYGVMREESRFFPRARSSAAARGLLQILTATARAVAWEMGLGSVEPEDLYDPPTAIRLGARYLADLGRRFGGDAPAAVAAYNAGPAQAALWRRLSPAPGPDFLLTAVSFEETRGYVDKVLRCRDRYRQLYPGDQPGP